MNGIKYVYFRKTKRKWLWRLHIRVKERFSLSIWDTMWREFSTFPDGRIVTFFLPQRKRAKLVIEFMNESCFKRMYMKSFEDFVWLLWGFTWQVCINNGSAWKGEWKKWHAVKWNYLCFPQDIGEVREEIKYSTKNAIAVPLPEKQVFLQEFTEMKFFRVENMEKWVISM